MSTFKITDSLSADLVSGAFDEQAGLGRYFKGAAALEAAQSVARALDTPLSSAPPDALQAGLTFTSPVAIGRQTRAGAAVDVSVTTGAQLTVSVHLPDGEPPFDEPVPNLSTSVSPGEAVVSLTVDGRVGLQASVPVPVAVPVGALVGTLTFGVDAGTGVMLRSLQRFDLLAHEPTLGEALSASLSRFVIPGDVADLAAMPVGSMASVAGHGRLAFAGSVALSSAVNMLATPALPLVDEALTVTTGASASLAATFALSGDFELRIVKTAPDVVRIAVRRASASALTVDGAAMLGVRATLGDSELISAFLSAVSTNPKADLLALVNAGLSDAAIVALQEAIKASLDRTLTLALELQLASTRSGATVFAYEVRLTDLNEASRQAVNAALGADLTPLIALMDAAGAGSGAPGDAAAASGASGVTLLTSAISTLRQRRLTWRINLLGIVNHLRISELIRQGDLLYDAATGELTAADRVSATKIAVTTRSPRAVDAEKLRKLRFESMIVTAAYRASRATASMTLSCTQSFFASDSRTSLGDMRGYLNALVELRLASAASSTNALAAGGDFGASTFLLDAELDDAACNRLFFDARGEPHDAAFYEDVGRTAIAALVQGREDAYRADALTDDVWPELRALGQASLAAALPPDIADDPLRVAVVTGDYSVIVWWAKAMRKAGVAIVALRRAIGGRPASVLATDPAFKRQRQDLVDAIADVESNSAARWNDPWGLLALDAASSRRATARATLISPRLQIVEERLALDEAAAVTRGMRAAAARRARTIEAPDADEMTLGVRATARGDQPALTADEKDLLRRHVINLRIGALSQGGEFQTTEADVDRLFGELLPAEIDARRADPVAHRRTLRLLFYAHGGLIGEDDGLRIALKQLAFWRANGIYPVFFTWETGLRESVRDILLGLGSAGRDLATKARGPLADAGVELLARQGGLAVWSQIKRSAEVSVLAGGGALLVAQRTRDFWARHHAEMEMHAAGHSAGSIFHAHYLPCLLGQPKPKDAPALTVRTLHFLAPAITTELFKAKLLGLVGKNKGIASLTMYTMRQELEKEDKTARPYGKSLLYLVSRAFETARETPILGLEESVRDDVALIRFFGLAGRQPGAAELLFSQTAPDASARSRTESRTHGGFDDDVATMNSAVRRMLDVSDDVAVDALVAAMPERDVEAVAAAGKAGHEKAGKAGVGSQAAAGAKAASKKSGKGDGAEAGARRALCVGIDAYPAPHALAGCVNDAKNWAKQMKALDFDVDLLLNGKATHEAILGTLGCYVAAAQPGDVLVFQFAGHGTQVEDLDADEREDALDEAFCPVDFAAGHLLVDDEFKQVFGALPDGVNLTCFFDCCHSGTITRAINGPRPTIPEGSRPRFMKLAPAVERKYLKQHGAALRAGDAGAGGDDDEAGGSAPVPVPLRGRARAAGGRAGARASAAERAGASRRAPAGKSPAAAAKVRMREVTFSACQSREVAFETNGHGQFTTRAMALFADGIESLTNTEFLDRIVDAFGDARVQTPVLDCERAARTRAFLQGLR